MSSVFLKFGQNFSAFQTRHGLLGFPRCCQVSSTIYFRLNLATWKCDSCHARNEVCLLSEIGLRLLSTSCRFCKVEKHFINSIADECKRPQYYKESKTKRSCVHFRQHHSLSAQQNRIFIEISPSTSENTSATYIALVTVWTISTFQKKKKNHLLNCSAVRVTQVRETTCPWLSPNDGWSTTELCF